MSLSLTGALVLHHQAHPVQEEDTSDNEKEDVGYVTQKSKQAKSPLQEITDCVPNVF